MTKPKMNEDHHRPVVVKYPVTINDSITANSYAFEFTESIESVEQYEELLSVLADMSEHDVLTLHISSCGGSLDVSLRIRDAILRCEGAVHSVLHGFVSSGATIVALAGGIENLTPAPHSTFHVHSLSTGTSGNIATMRGYTDYMNAYNKRLMRDIYGELLGEDVLTRALNGEEVYISSTDLTMYIEEALAEREDDATDYED